MVSNNFSPRKNLKTVWRNIAVALFAAVFALLGLCVTIIPTHAADDETFITIGEIYNNPTNMQKLYDALRGATSGTTYTQIATMANQEQKPNAATFRALNNDRDIKVTFGGKEWHVCYLSTDTDGNPILTLLLTTPSNVARDFLYVNDQVIDVEYPSDLYGTSYVRVVGLNNGGEYLSAAETLTKVDPVVDHPLARYTVTDLQNSVTKVIVKPEKVAWQESGTPTMDHYRELNSQWGAESPTENWYDRYYELTQKYGYDAWKNDFLWLPSFYEMKNTEKDRFVYYAELLEKTIGEKLVMNPDFTIMYERHGLNRSSQHLSAGQKSICTLCFRLALIDNMFAKETPFLIMDDPFVHLDDVHLDKVKKLMHELGKTKQIIYFTCQNVRDLR